MSLRSGNIGFAVTLALIAVGLLIVGTNPSDTEMQLIFWPAFAAGIAVVFVVVSRDAGRDRDHRPHR